ncbi:protein of unknown function [Cyanobium sp. NIES-981]|nr:protein of unknown function [Cyanobium sp. NIES-981]
MEEYSNKKTMQCLLQLFSDVLMNCFQEGL